MVERELLLRYSLERLGRVRMGNGPTMWLLERSKMSREVKGERERERERMEVSWLSCRIRC